MVDLVEECVDGAGVEVVVAVPAAVAVGPVERPGVAGGVVAELGDGTAGPVGQVGVPGRPAVEDGDGFAAGVGLDAGFVAEVGGDAAVAELADAGKVEVGNRGHSPTVGSAQPASRRRVRFDASVEVGAGSGVAGMAASVLVVVLATVPARAASESRDPKVNQAPVTRMTSPQESRLPGAG